MPPRRDSGVKVQVGQLLTNLRVSSSNMLLPFTAQILHLLEDSPANVTTGIAKSSCEHHKAKNRMPVNRMVCSCLEPRCSHKKAIYALQILLSTCSVYERKVYDCTQVIAGGSLVSSESEIPVPTKKSDGTFPGLKVCCLTALQNPHIWNCSCSCTASPKHEPF